MQLAQGKQKTDDSPFAGKLGGARRVLSYVRNFAAIFQNEALIYANPAGAAMLGVEDASALIGMSFSDLLHPTYKEIGSLDLSMLADDDNLIIKLHSETINSIDVHIWITAMPDVGDNIYMLEAREITKHLRSAAELRVREQHLQAVLNTVPDCILTLDKDRRIIAANPATIDEFQLEPGTVRHKDIMEFVPQLADYNLAEMVNSSWERSYQADKYWFGLRGGETFPIELVIRAMQDGPETNYTCIIRNVEERVQAEEELHRHLRDLEHNQMVLEDQASEAVYLAEELEFQKRASEHLALHDPLTDLPNRRYFNEFLAKSIATANREKLSVCLLFIDLDKFKDVNDTLGHDVGDDLLLQVSAHLLKNTRDRDMVARLGGDEFAVVLNSPHQIAEEVYSQIAGRILEDLYIPIDNDGDIIQASASIGAALFPKDAGTVVDLVKLADATMYEAKKNGRNQVIFAGR